MINENDPLRYTPLPSDRKEPPLTDSERRIVARVLREISMALVDVITPVVPYEEGEQRHIRTAEVVLAATAGVLSLRAFEIELRSSTEDSL